MFKTNKEKRQIAVFLASQPDQSGYVRVELVDNKFVYTPISKKDFYLELPPENKDVTT